MVVFESNHFHGVFITDFTSCFFFSSVLMFFCFKTCSARSLLNCCSPHNFRFLSHDFPRAGGATSPCSQTAGRPCPEGQLPQRAVGSSVVSAEAVPRNRALTGAGASDGRPHAVHPSNYPAAHLPSLHPLNPNMWGWGEKNPICGNEMGETRVYGLDVCVPPNSYVGT